MGWNICPRPSFGVFLDGSSSRMAAEEVLSSYHHWNLAFFLLALACVLLLLLSSPITSCLPGCLPWPGDNGWELSPVSYPAQLPDAAGRAGSPPPLLLLQQRILTNGTRKERANHKARQQQGGGEPVFRSLANKNISNSRLGIVKQAGRPGMWPKVSWDREWEKTEDEE